MGCSNPPSIKGSVNLYQEDKKDNSILSKDKVEKQNKSKNEQEINGNEKQNKNKNKNKNENLKENKGNKKLKEIKLNKKQNQNQNNNEIENEIENEEEKKQENNDLNELEKKRLLELEIKRLEEEKKQKEKEEKEKKEEEERERKKIEEEEAQEFERQQKEREEWIKSEMKKKYEINLYLLLKNLEAINKNIETLREDINEVFNSIIDYQPKNFEKTKDSIINNVLDKIKIYLEIDNNYTDINIIKNLLIISFEERNIDQFKDYLNVILNSVKNYYNIKNENSIINYIIDYLSEKEELKEEVENKYKEAKIIRYDDFCKITNQFEVVMQNTPMEYLIFKMKSTKLENVTLMFDELNVIEFLRFFNEENKQEDNSIKIGIRIRE